MELVASVVCVATHILLQPTSWAPTPTALAANSGGVGESGLVVLYGDFPLEWFAASPFSIQLASHARRIAAIEEALTASSAGGGCVIS